MSQVSLPSRVDRLLQSAGNKVLRPLREGRELAKLMGQTVRGAWKRDYPRGEVIRQMYLVGNKSVLFLSVTMGFLGLVMVMQSGQQINRVTGDLSRMGPEFLKLFIQEFGPTLTALMLATRVGAGIAAEVGSMKVTEQIDALRLCGITPTSYLIAPRYLACLFMTYVLTVIAIGVSFTAGGLAASSVFGLNAHVFFDASHVRAYDLILGSLKVFCYGSAIPVISGYCGMRAKGGSEGVGMATTQAVIASSSAILSIDFFLSGIGFAVFGGGV